MSVNHYENFPVASFLVPRNLRPAIIAIYRFARSADDIADEGNLPTVTRQKQLLLYVNALQALEASADQFPHAQIADELHPVFLPLWETIRRHDLPLAPFFDLLQAFMQDTNHSGYADFSEVLEYCRYSANPVGRILLHLYQVPVTSDILAQSDAVCTALQLINFLQDIAIDWNKQRVYLPQSELTAIDRTPNWIASLLDSNSSVIMQHTDWQNFMGFQVARARKIMLQGATLVQHLPGRLRWELKATILGGLTILDRMECNRYDVFFQRPELKKQDYWAIGWKCLRFSATLTDYSKI